MFVLLARRPRLRRAVTLQSRSAGRRDARGRSAAAASRSPRRECGRCEMHYWAPARSSSQSVRQPDRLLVPRGPSLACSVYSNSAVCHWGIVSCLYILNIRLISDKFDSLLIQFTLSKELETARDFGMLLEHSRDPYPRLGLRVYYIRSLRWLLRVTTDKR